MLKFSKIDHHPSHFDWIIGRPCLNFLRFRDSLNTRWNCTKEWRRTFPICLLCIRDQRGTASLRRRNSAEIAILMWTESLSGMIFVQVQKLFGILWRDKLRKKLGWLGWRANRFSRGVARIFQRGSHRQGHHPGIADYIWFIPLLYLVYQPAQSYYRGIKAHIN